MEKVRDYARKRIVYRSFLFDELNLTEGYGIPSKAFLAIWNSEKRELVARAGFTLIPVLEGDVRVGWKVLLPRASGVRSRSISNIMQAGH